MLLTSQNQSVVTGGVMKTTLTVLFTSLIALAPVALGETYKTLNGYKASFKIPADETVFVVSATSRVVLGVQNPGKREFQYRFERAENGFSYRLGDSASRTRNLLPTPSVNNPVPITGPATLVLRTSGLITLLVPEEVRRTSTTTSARSVRRFAKN